MPQAKLYIRISLPDGTHPYVKPAWTPKGRLKPLVALIDGRPEHHPEGTYVLRYTQGGKRKWELVGSDPSVAVLRLQQRNHALQGEALGVTPSVPEPDSGPTVPQVASSQRLLSESATEYLAETKLHKSPKTLASYTETLDSFQVSCKKKYLEQITREDVLAYASFLRAKGNAPRTVRNRIDYLQIFLHHFGLPSLLKGKDLPKYTEKQVRAYNPLQLRKMFGHATREESDLLHFLLCTGTREQEAAFACWTDVDFESKTYTVTEHLDLGFRPKDKEEGTIPIPDSLVEILQARRKRYPESRLIFPTKNNRPSGHMLRVIKALALRAGVNCGHCINKGGKSCAKHPVCKHVILHKMRKTFASQLSRNGVPPRTLMRYLRHSDLDVTLRYIADEDDDQLRETINRTFAAPGGAQ